MNGKDRARAVRDLITLAMKEPSACGLVDDYRSVESIIRSPARRGTAAVRT